MDSFSNATAAAFVRYLTFTGTARRCGSFHYWRKATTYCYLFLAVYKTIRVFFILSLCKKSFSFSSNAHLPSSILKENKRNIQKQLLGDVQQKSVLLCHISMMWTLVDLSCTKRLFSQETVFFPILFYQR